MPKPKVKVVVNEVVGQKIYQTLDDVAVPEGHSFMYKNYLKEKMTVNVPVGYDYVKVGDLVYCSRLPTNVSAVPVIKVNGFMVGEPQWVNAPAANWTRFLANDLTARHTKSVHGKKDVPWLWILVIIGVIIILFIGYKMMSQKTTPQVTPVEQGQQ